MKQGIAKADKARASRSRSKHSIYLECGKRLWSSMHSDPRYAIPLQDGTRFMRIVLSFAQRSHIKEVLLKATRRTDD
jgi:hypothetical protein